MPYKDPEKRKANNRKLNKEYYDRIRSQKTPQYERMLDGQNSRQKEWVKNLTAEEREVYLRSCANRRMKRKYGIGVEEFDRMSANQKGLCSICGKPQQHGWRLAIDHNHKTGQVRDLLCTRCNTVIGHMEDDIKLLQSAIKYLRKHGA
jgi:hypothetical protein